MIEQERRKKSKLSDDMLRSRIEKLRERGIDPCFGQNVTVLEVLDIVGDLSLDELRRLQQLAATEIGVRRTPEMAKPTSLWIRPDDSTIN
jgi:hypothetical protein